MKKFVEPEMDITIFDTEDVIVTSGEDAGYDAGGGDGEVGGDV